METAITLEALQSLHLLHPHQGRVAKQTWREVCHRTRKSSHPEALCPSHDALKSHHLTDSAWEVSYYIRMTQAEHVQLHHEQHKEPKTPNPNSLPRWITVYIVSMTDIGSIVGGIFRSLLLLLSLLFSSSFYEWYWRQSFIPRPGVSRAWAPPSATPLSHWTYQAYLRVHGT